jgi:hypothetical protein
MSYAAASPTSPFSSGAWSLPSAARQFLPLTRRSSCQRLGGMEGALLVATLAGSMETRAATLDGGDGVDLAVGGGHRCCKL